MQVAINTLAVSLIALTALALTAPAAVRAQSGTAKLKILGGEPGAVVRVNGEYLDRLPMKHAARVEAGMLFLEVEADGYRIYQQTVDVAPYSRKRVRVELIAEPEPPLPGAALVSASANVVDPMLRDDSVAGLGVRTISIYDLKRPAIPPSTAEPATEAKTALRSKPPALPVAARPAPAAVGSARATARPALAAVRSPSVAPGTASSPPSRSALIEPRPTAVSGPMGRSTRVAAAPRAPISAADTPLAPAGGRTGAAARKVAVEQPLLPEDGGSGSPIGSPRAVSSTGSVAALDQAGSKEGDSYPGERESEGPDDFDPFNVDVYGGYSYLLMVLGHEDPPTPEQVQSMTPEEIERLRGSTPADLVDTVQGAGVNTGAAVWLRYNPVWLGVRFGYATYDPASVLTVIGELGMRYQGNVAEVYFGFGLGSGWLYGVSPERVNASSGLALKFGLGLNFFVARDVAFGLGVDAVGLFLAGNGISPSQIGDFDPERSNHPIGLQLPFVLNLGLRT